MSRLIAFDEMIFREDVNSEASTSKSGSLNSASYVEALSSTAHTVDFIVICFRYSTYTGPVLFDVGVGAASSEETIIDKMLFSSSITFGRQCTSVLVPVSVPAGTRLAVRAYQRDGTTAVNLDYQLMLFGVSGDGRQSYSRCENIGIVDIDPGATANTKSAYVQIEDSTLVDYSALMVTFFNEDPSPNKMHFLFDVSIGAASSEITLLSDQYMNVDTADAMPIYSLPLYPFVIPAGSRLSARAQCSSTVSPDRLVGAAIWGFR